MPTLQNPLRRPRPERDETVHRVDLHVADEEARYVDGFQYYKVRLTRDCLWLSRDLALPLECIRVVEPLQRGKWVKRHALRIVYRNPITGTDESVQLCRRSFTGYSEKPLVKLRALVQDQLEIHGELEPAMVENIRREEREPVELTCEVCGRRPAVYVGYRSQVGLLSASVVTAEKRRTHCSRHNLLVGGWSYLVTTLTGWWGLCILTWPQMVWERALAMRPAIGRLAYALGVLPVLLLFGGIAYALLTR